MAKINVFGWFRRGDGGHEPSDPVRREAEALYARLSDEVREVFRHSFSTNPPMPSAQQVVDAAPEVQGAVLQVACERALASTREDNGGRPEFARSVIHGLLKRKLEVPSQRVAAILAIWAEIGPGYDRFTPLPALLRLVSRPPTPAEVESLQLLRASMARFAKVSAGPRKAVAQIDEILQPDGERTLVPGGTWSRRVLADIARFDPAVRDAWCELVRHLLTLGNTEPTKKWDARLGEHLQAVGPALFQQHALEWIALGPMPDPSTTPQVPEKDADYLKGVVWALSACDHPQVARALADLAEQCLKKVPNYGPISMRVGNACIRALMRFSGTEPVAQLGRLGTRVKYVAGQKLIEKAIAEAATSRGLTPEALEEIAVPTFDLDQDGRWQSTIAGYTAEIRITGTADVTLSWLTVDGARQKSVPAAIKTQHATELRPLKQRIKQITDVLPAQKVRIERLLESTRQIPFDEWQAHYARHPLIGHLARRLIWQFSQPSQPAQTDRAEIELGAFADGQLVNVDDRPLDWLSSSSMVRLWHPLGTDPDEVMRWRRWLDRHAVVQPFKQAHREIYLLTPAERETGIYSNRFAAHVIRQHQFAALCRERGWRYHLQGDWDSANTPVRELRRWDLQLQFWVEAPTDRVGMVNSGIFQYLYTDQVRFCRQGAPVRLEEVPPIAFSEAMRDVDLFVGVCSVGNDPTWADRGPEPGFATYWHGVVFGELSEVAKTRRVVLEGLIPKLKCASRLSLEDRFLVVRGALATYKIHLGSGNVLMEPGTRYLCIVPARGTEPPLPRGAGRVWLPFEGDNGLTIILSKALMLADDTKITDPQLLQQIRLALSAS